jgi:hypothetical protein
MRQEIRLLGGKLKIIFFFLKNLLLLLLLFLNNQGYHSNRLPNCIQAFKTNMTKLLIYTPQTTCQCARENQIENVISHAAKEINTI